MAHAIPVVIPSDHNVVMTKEMFPSTEEQRAAMKDKDYRGFVGSLMYLMTGTRPDIAFARQSVSTYLQNLASSTGMQRNESCATSRAQWRRAW